MYTNSHITVYMYIYIKGMIECIDMYMHMCICIYITVVTLMAPQYCLTHTARLSNEVSHFCHLILNTN
jgi:hypothetical protein